ncbi:MAG: TRAP transporter substrate-binding protein DctP [Chloroflexi bacterium]|nr:TRAP transporter substrate-binding protein DctP [Chloroflexota bacterium]
MRKILFPGILLALILMLAACGGDDESDTKSDTTASTGTTASSSADDGKVYSFQFACINRTLKPCELMMELAANVAARTNGQIEIQISSFPELGLAGPDTLRLLQDGTLDFGEIYGGYVGGDFPAIEMAELLGLYESSAMQEEVFRAVREDEIRMVRDQFGAEVISYIYYPDQFIFSKTPLRTLKDFKGLKIRTHSTALGDLAAGLGAEGQFIAFSEVYTALERGILDAGVTGSTPAYGQKWYEVSKYIVGPLTSHPHVMVAMNKARWDALPTNLQQILKEEAAKTEAKNLEVVNGWDQEGVDLGVAEGMEHIPFTPEIKEAIKAAVLNRIVPNWAKRAGGYDSEAVQIFNAKVAPIVGVKINPDGSASPTQ